MHKSNGNLQFMNNNISENEIDSMIDYPKIKTINGLIPIIDATKNETKFSLKSNIGGYKDRSAFSSFKLNFPQNYDESKRFSDTNIKKNKKHESKSESAFSTNQPIEISDERLNQSLLNYQPNLKDWNSNENISEKSLLNNIEDLKEYFRNQDENISEVSEMPERDLEEILSIVNNLVETLDSLYNKELFSSKISPKKFSVSRSENMIQTLNSAPFQQELDYVQNDSALLKSNHDKSFITDRFSNRIKSLREINEKISKIQEANDERSSNIEKSSQSMLRTSFQNSQFSETGLNPSIPNRDNSQINTENRNKRESFEKILNIVNDLNEAIISSKISVKKLSVPRSENAFETLSSVPFKHVLDYVQDELSQQKSNYDKSSINNRLSNRIESLRDTNEKMSKIREENNEKSSIIERTSEPLLRASLKNKSFQKSQMLEPGLHLSIPNRDVSQINTQSFNKSGRFEEILNIVNNLLEALDSLSNKEITNFERFLQKDFNGESKKTNQNIKSVIFQQILDYVQDELSQQKSNYDKSSINDKLSSKIKSLRDINEKMSKLQEVNDERNSIIERTSEPLLRASLQNKLFQQSQIMEPGLHLSIPNPDVSEINTERFNKNERFSQIEKSKLSNIYGNIPIVYGEKTSAIERTSEPLLRSLMSIKPLRQSQPLDLDLSLGIPNNKLNSKSYHQEIPNILPIKQALKGSEIQLQSNPFYPTNISININEGGHTCKSPLSTNSVSVNGLHYKSEPLIKYGENEDSENVGCMKPSGINKKISTLLNENKKPYIQHQEDEDDTEELLGLCQKYLQKKKSIPSSANQPLSTQFSKKYTLIDEQYTNSQIPIIKSEKSQKMNCDLCSENVIKNVNFTSTSLKKIQEMSKIPDDNLEFNGKPFKTCMGNSCSMSSSKLGCILKDSSSLNANLSTVPLRKNNSFCSKCPCTILMNSPTPLKYENNNEIRKCGLQSGTRCNIINPSESKINETPMDYPVDKMHCPYCFHLLSKLNLSPFLSSSMVINQSNKGVTLEQQPDFCKPQNKYSLRVYSSYRGTFDNSKFLTAQKTQYSLNNASSCNEECNIRFPVNEEVYSQKKQKNYSISEIPLTPKGKNNILECLHKEKINLLNDSMRGIKLENGDLSSTFNCQLTDSMQKKYLQNYGYETKEKQNTKDKMNFPKLNEKNPQNVHIDDKCNFYDYKTKYLRESQYCTESCKENSCQKPKFTSDLSIIQRNFINEYSKKSIRNCENKEKKIKISKSVFTNTDGGRSVQDCFYNDTQRKNKKQQFETYLYESENISKIKPIKTVSKFFEKIQENKNQKEALDIYETFSTLNIKKVEPPIAECYKNISSSKNYYVEANRGMKQVMNIDITPEKKLKYMQLSKHLIESPKVPLKQKFENCNDDTGNQKYLANPLESRKDKGISDKISTIRQSIDSKVKSVRQLRKNELKGSSLTFGIPISLNSRKYEDQANMSTQTFNACRCLISERSLSSVVSCTTSEG